jgi:hypothetical protein
MESEQKKSKNQVLNHLDEVRAWSMDGEVTSPKFTLILLDEIERLKKIEALAQKLTSHPGDVLLTDLEVLSQALKTGTT